MQPTLMSRPTRKILETDDVFLRTSTADCRYEGLSKIRFAKISSHLHNVAL